MKENIYHYVSVLFQEKMLPYMIFFALVITGLVCLVQLLRCSPLEKGQFQKAFQRIGLHNSIGEKPVFLSKRKDKHKEHGAIYKLNNVGISIADFDSKNAQLEAALNLVIYRIEYGKKAQKILLYAISRKHAKPTIISLDDEYFGEDRIGALINCLVVGATGTGKTVALKVIMAKIAKYQPTAKIWILDFKHYDFRDFDGCPNHYGYSDCVQGLNDFYNAFKLQQGTGVADCPQYLIFDEWGSFILSQEKKQAEELKARLSELLMLGRSYRFFPIIGLQRADSAHFSSGARDQFRNILLLGNVSKEQKMMLVPDYKDKLAECNGLGDGNLFRDGKGMEKVKIVVRDFDALNYTIRQAMCR